MVDISLIFESFNYFFGNSYVLIAIFTTLLSIKIVILATFIFQVFYKKYKNFYIILLIGILISSITCDSCWILLPFTPYLSFILLNFFVRLSWITTVSLYQFLALFIERLAQPKKKIPTHQKIFFIISTTIMILFITILIGDFYCTSIIKKSYLERILTKIIPIYTGFILLPCSLLFSFSTFRKNSYPNILKKQLRLFIGTIVIPMWFSDTMQILSMIIAPIGVWFNTSYAFVNLANLLITYGIFYSARKMMRLRFLNIKQQVSIPTTVNFVHNTKDILLQLSQVTSEGELSRLTQTFFKDSFNIIPSKVTLYIRPTEKTRVDEPLSLHHDPLSMYTIMESFITNHGATMNNHIDNILVYDELVFSNFYESLDSRSISIQFLDMINADIFIPIYVKNTIIGSIVIEKKARHTMHLYSQTECDHMIIFGSYLGNLINLLQNRNLEMLIFKEKQLTDELYAKQQTINQYHESIHSFLHTNENNMIGIIFYKNRSFSFGNQTAKQMIKITLNNNRGHPITKACMRAINHVETYKTTYTIMTKDSEHRNLVLCAIPHLDEHSIIIIASYPDITNSIKKQIDLLKNPAERDYLLYLKSTRAGHIINEYLPTNIPIILEKKIDLLKIGLNDKPALLLTATKDLLPIATIIHQINLRNPLRHIVITPNDTSLTIGTKLFGLNPLLALSNSTEKPLIAEVANHGTLLIEHIDLMDIESQRHLLELLKFGYYRMIKSDRKEPCRIKLLCTSSMPLKTAAEHGSFLLELYTIITEQTICIPPIHSIPTTELEQFIDDYAEQKIKNESFKNCFIITESEKRHILRKEIDSINGLYLLIDQLLVKKSSKYLLESNTHPLPEQPHDESALLNRAAQLGKNALKDPVLMEFLWKTYKNQHKIAVLLGVNRSSVNRRCKGYRFFNSSPEKNMML